jgi:hypothetical protein
MWANAAPSAACIGRGPLQATDVILVVYCFGSLVSYLLIISGTTTDMLKDWGVLTTPLVHGASNRQVAILVRSVGRHCRGRLAANVSPRLPPLQLVLWLISLIALWPLVLLPRLHFLRHVSFVASACLAYLVVVVVYRAMQVRALCVVRGGVRYVACASAWPRRRRVPVCKCVRHCAAARVCKLRGGGPPLADETHTAAWRVSPLHIAAGCVRC